MYDQMCQVLYGYILQAEVLFMRYYKIRSRRKTL